MDDRADGTVELSCADAGGGLLEDIEGDLEGFSDVEAFLGADDGDGCPTEAFEFFADVFFVSLWRGLASGLVRAIFGDVPFVEDDDDGFVGVDDELSELFVDLGDLGGGVEHVENDIGAGYCAFGAVECVVLDFVLKGFFAS